MLDFSQVWRLEHKLRRLNVHEWVPKGPITMENLPKLHKQFSKINRMIDLQNWKPSEFSTFDRMIFGVTCVAQDTLRTKAIKGFNAIAKARKELKACPIGRWQLKLSSCYLLKRSYSFSTFLRVRKQLRGKHKITKVIYAS